MLIQKVSQNTAKMEALFLFKFSGVILFLVSYHGFHSYTFMISPLMNAEQTFGRIHWRWDINFLWNS